jgi:hypothetical protein
MCQGIQTKNSFDEILSLSFDLGFLKWTTMHQTRVNFVKDYQNDSYNKNTFDEKKLRG